MAHIRQSRPDPGLDFQLEVTFKKPLKPFKVFSLRVEAAYVWEHAPLTRKPLWPEPTTGRVSVCESEWERERVRERVCERERERKSE